MGWLKKQDGVLERVRQAGDLDAAQPDVHSFLASGEWGAVADISQAIQPLLLEACACCLTQERNASLPRDPRVAAGLTRERSPSSPSSPCHMRDG
jgi:hypothetical protein